MRMDELFSDVLKHPGIPLEMQTFIFNKFCDGSTRLTFRNFAIAIALLTKKDAFNRSIIIYY